MVYEGLGSAALRAELIDRLVKGFAAQIYNLKKLVQTPKVGAWMTTYYRETAAVLAAGTIVDRMAPFPNVDPSWEEIQSRQRKFAAEATISIEDEMMDNIPVISRAQFKIAQAVAKAVEDNIYTGLNATGIETFAATATWDNATRANRLPHDDLGNAYRLIAENNYTATDIIVNPLDAYLISTNDNVLDAFTPTQNVLATGMLKGRDLVGMKFNVSNSVTADEAMVVAAKICATWRSGSGGIKTAKEVMQGKGTRLLAWELGVLQVTDPGAICRITNTNA